MIVPGELADDENGEKMTDDEILALLAKDGVYDQDAARCVLESLRSRGEPLL